MREPKKHKSILTKENMNLINNNLREGKTNMKKKETHKPTCPICKSTNLKKDEVRAETICMSCYTVIETPYKYVAGKPINIPNSYNYTLAKQPCHYQIRKFINQHIDQTYTHIPNQNIIKLNRQKRLTQPIIIFNR